MWLLSPARGQSFNDNEKYRACEKGLDFWLSESQIYGDYILDFG
jgi:hypothetical protein